MNLRSPGAITRLSLLWICCQSALAWPDERKEEDVARASLAGVYAGPPKPNAELPKHVPAPAGKLTFFADFAAAERNQMPEEISQYMEERARQNRRVPLYLVNRTAQALNLPFQDGDANVRLEYRDTREGWVRTQPQYSSWCGNSYYARKLEPGQFLVMTGLMERDGTPATVRFASIGGRDLVSNEGKGWYSPDDLKIAQMDDSARYLPGPLSGILEPRDEIEDPLGEYVAAMRLAQSLGGSLYYRKVALDQAKALEEKAGSTQEDKSAAEALRKIAAAHWPAARNDAALRERCLRALTHPGSSNHEFGAPESFPTLCWSVLEDLERQCPYAEVPDWKAVVDLLLKAEKPSEGFHLLDNPLLADELVPESYFEKHLLDDDATTRLTCARVIKRREGQEWLAGLASKLSPAGQMEVLRVLVEPPEPGDLRTGSHRPSDAEMSFVRHCMQTQPSETAIAITPNYLFDEDTYLALRKFIIEEADKSSTAREDFRQEESYKLASAVSLLAKMDADEDVELLKKLLAYRGYEECEATTGGTDPKTIKYQTFRVRQSAKDALLARHLPVPEDLVLERAVPKATP
ncbi:hypothetical protein BH09VER1_BH09VER1_55170 [soil metagenome]